MHGRGVAGYCAAISRVAARAIVAIAVFTALLVGGFPDRHGPRVSADDQVLAEGVHGKGYDADVPDVGVDAEMVGFSWTGGTSATIRVRGFVAGTWQEWLTLEGSPSEQPDTTSVEHRPGQVSAGPAWLGDDFRRVQVQVTGGTVTDLRLTAIDTEPPVGPGPLATPTAAGLPSWPAGIVPRSAWGADESYRTFAPGCDGQPRYARELRFAVVHHTVSSNDYGPGDSSALIRGIYYFHTHTNLWCDVAYNFFADRYGQVFEGRAGGINRTTIGGHAGGFNLGSTGVAVIGDFTSSAVPVAAYNALKNLLIWKLAYHGIDPLGSTVEVSGGGSARWPAGTVVTLPNLEGHRDSNTTGCPGQMLYNRLPQLRQDVAAGIAGSSTDQRLTCDWDGDGDETPAFFAAGTWYIRNTTGEAYPDWIVPYGTADYKAVCGDWDDDGRDTIGVYYQGWWWLRNSNSPGPPDITVQYGTPAYTPVVGDWDGDGRDTIGVYFDGWWWARNANVGGWPQISFRYGIAAYKPVVGDWDGNGTETVGVFDGNWYLRNSNDPGAPHITSQDYGRLSDQPLAGDWDGDRSDSIGIARGAYWYLSPRPQSTAADSGFPY